jgi:hypothetical protein
MGAEDDPVLETLGPVIGLLPEADKTGGIWRFDETKANAVLSTTKTTATEKTELKA